MNLLDYYRVGKTTLPKGVPLRVAVRLRIEEDGSSTSPGEEFTRPSLRLAGSEMIQKQDLETFEFRPSQASGDGRFLFEVPTEQFAAGAFELYIEAGEEEQVQIPEEVWILEEEDYRALIEETREEEFLPSPGLPGGETVVHYVANLISERLSRDNFERDGFTNFDFHYRLLKDIPDNFLFPSSPIRWTTEQVVNEFRELALYGVADVQWTLELTSRRYRLQCRGELLDPLSSGAAESFHGVQNSQLSLLNRSEDLKGLELKQEIQYDWRHFAVEASHNVDNFEPIEPICPVCGEVHRDHR